MVVLLLLSVFEFYTWGRTHVEKLSDHPITQEVRCRGPLHCAVSAWLKKASSAS